VIATAVVVAEWSTQTIAALHHGMMGADNLWYHLPMSARFVQEGSITGVHYVDSQAIISFYPANSEVLHALGILLLGNDLLSPLLNMGFLALTLLAAWCVGRPFGVAPVTLTGVALVLGLPVLTATQPGGGYSDIVGIALLLSTVAILLQARPPETWLPPAALVIAALGAGFALGTKWQFLVPVAALSLGVIVVAPRGQRLRTALLWLPVVGISGGYWYLRNLIVAGNPIPPMDIEIGPVSLPSITLRTPEFTVAEYLFDGEVWRDFFLPGLTQAFGPASWPVLALVLLAIVFGVVAPRSRVHRMLAIVGAVGLVAYLVTPAFHGLPNRPIFFVYNLRYAAIAMVLAVAVLPLARVFSGRLVWAVLGVFGLALVATQLDPSIWPTELRDDRFGEPIRGIDSVAAVITGTVVLVGGLGFLALRERRPGWRPQVAAVVVLAGAVVVGGFVLQEAYLQRRYADAGDLYEWARDEKDERIAVAGLYLNLQYPFYGTDLSNHVQYVGEQHAYGDWGPINDCASWREALNAGRYTYVMPGPSTRDIEPREEVWTRTDPAASLVMRDGMSSLYRLDGDLDPSTCERSELSQ
jgi:hypothetical protein